MGPSSVWGVVAADPELNPGEGVLAVFAEAEVGGLRLHLVDRGLEVGLLVGGEGVEGVLKHGGVGLFGEHVQEVLADQLGVDVHEQAVGVLSDEVPDVVEGLVAGVVVHKDLVQSLQREIALVLLGSGAVGGGPVEGDEGVEDAGLNHLGLNLVAVLDEGHGKGAGVLQRVAGELAEDVVVLRLLPVYLHVVARVDALQVLDEERKGGGAAAGVADADKGLAVGLLDGLGGQLLKGHALGFLDYLLRGCELGVLGRVVDVAAGGAGGGGVGAAAGPPGQRP